MKKTTPLNIEEEREIVEAIRKAEQQTSGEIRVHLEARCKGQPMKRAKFLFYKMKMFNTHDRNAVLFYIAWEDKNFALFGDEEIHAVVGDTFWNEASEILKDHFKKERFKEGLIKAIEKISLQLQKHFPYNFDDKNELSDELSKE